jgi:NADPH-dependent 2,4-dienoyl-CoA reductase/sulfur reductase-like enzyme/bacterioferritin-associated ferredoxin
MTRAVEIVVVGGGPGGLSAALAAARAGAKVMLLDGYTHPGGQYYLQPHEGLKPNRRQQEGQRLEQEVRFAGVEILTGAAVWNLSSDLTLTFAARDHSRQVKAGAVILASGAYERIPAFPGWTLPGVITSGAAQALLYQHVSPGRCALVCGTGPLQLTTAMKLLHAGVEVAAVLEGSDLVRLGWSQVGRMWGQWERAAEGMESLLTFARHRTPYQLGWGLVAAHGGREVEGATIARLDADWRPIPGSEREVACDTICTGYGLIPFNALSRIAGAAQEWRPELGGEIPAHDGDMQTSVAGLYAAGDGAGIGGYKMALIEGAIAGICASDCLGHLSPDQDAVLRRLAARRRQEAVFQQLYSRLFTPGPGIYELAQDDTLVCRCEGVTLGHIRRAVQESPVSAISELKNLTRCGMGECQGRICGQQVAHLLAGLSGRTPDQIGLYNPRPPIFPMPLEQLVIEE